MPSIKISFAIPLSLHEKFKNQTQGHNIYLKSFRLSVSFSVADFQMPFLVLRII